MGGAVTNPGSTISDFNALVHCVSKQLGQEAPPVQLLTILMIKQSGKPPRLRTKAAETRCM
eukprot:8918910-Pyramimonas_sp.AAC.2